MVEGHAKKSVSVFSYFDLMYFVLAYEAKYGHIATHRVIRAYVCLGDGPLIRNVPERAYLSLAEDLVRRY